MKIAHVVCVFPPYKGGIGNVTRDFAELSQESGFDTTVFCPMKKGGKMQEVGRKINIVRLRPFLSFGNGAFLPQLFFRLKGFDIVHLHYPFFGTAEIVFLLKWIYGKKFKLVVHYHMDTDGLAFIPKVLSVFSRSIFGSLFKQADIITYASEDYLLSGPLAKRYKEKKSKFFLLPFGVDTANFHPAQKEKEDSGVKILFVGALDSAHYFKGVDILIMSLSDILSEEVRLDIIGKGKLRESYEKIADESGIGKYVNFLGGVSDDELASAYRQADIFVLPSINSHEAFGVVLLEAMASGVPVIASDLPGVRSVFTDGQEGLQIIPGNQQDLSAKIEYLLQNRALRVQMGRNARKLALDKYSFDLLKSRLKSLYENLFDK
jgi:glycosyltransferase involved in cell wall biosynthesis